VVSQSVCLLVMFVSSAKAAELIEMSFGRLTLVGPRNCLLDRVKVGSDKSIYCHEGC